MKIPPNRERGRQTERQRELFKQPVLMDSALLQVTDNVWIFSPRHVTVPEDAMSFSCVSLSCGEGCQSQQYTQCQCIMIPYTFVEF